MPWTTPRTWTVGETLTAANLNTYLSDNDKWLGTDKPHCSAVRTSNQSIPDATLTVVTLTGTDEWDVGNMHDPASNPSRVTVPSGGAGVYQVHMNLTWDVSSAGSRDILLLKNGSAITGASDTRPNDAGGNTVQPLSIAVALVAADYIEIQVAHSAGAPLNVTHARLQLLWYST